MKSITLAVFVAVAIILVFANPREKTSVEEQPIFTNPADIDEALVETLDMANVLAKELVDSLAGTSEIAQLEAAGLNLLIREADIEAAAYALLLNETAIKR